jgi:hypothetical protein
MALAPILLTALVCSGCPELNTQPDYLGEKNSLMSVPDPLPPVDPLAPYKASDGDAVIDVPDSPPAPAASSSDPLGHYVQPQAGIIRPTAGVFDHGSISISEEGGLSDQARRAQ